MKQKRWWIWLWGIIVIYAMIAPSVTTAQVQRQIPLVILTIDKIETTRFFESKLPGIKRLLAESSLGLMNVRSASGYNAVGSYLTLGSGTRALDTAKVTEEAGAADTLKIDAVYRPDELIFGKKARLWWNWTQDKEDLLTPENLIVPEIELIKNQAKQSKINIQPGLLGEIFHQNHWQTGLLGGVGSKANPRRVSGLLLMNQQGIIDFGYSNERLYEPDLNFPGGLRFSPNQVIQILTEQLKRKQIILVDFDDFALLDQEREWILPEHYSRLKETAWLRLDNFLTQILQRWSREELNLIILSPSPSKEAIMQKNLLLPMAIRTAKSAPGLLTSGTTKWTGLVANLDLLPTTCAIAQLEKIPDFNGRTVKTIATNKYLFELQNLNQKINRATINQRALLDLFMGMITVAWILALTLYFFKQKQWSMEILLLVLIAPLVLLVMPLLPATIWGIASFISLTLICWGSFRLVPKPSRRFLIVTMFLWVLLILDQATGWQMIRYSALGYSAAAGSRYYGMGNEYMGIFLALTLILADHTEKINKRLLTVTIFGVASLTLALPWLGINFGGLLAALIGFGYYLLRLYGWKPNNRKFWLALGGAGALVFLIGWWDSLRDPTVQTHLGRFVNNLLAGEKEAVWQIIERKLAMNLKLIIFSPWTRIILLALVIGIVARVKRKKPLCPPSETRLWQALLVAGVAALVFNDSGVVAFATCLSYGFTFILMKLDFGAV